VERRPCSVDNGAVAPCAVAGCGEWAVEAFKWQLLLQPVQGVDYRTALRSTLIGTSLGLFTPNRTGEVLGRAMMAPPGSRRKAGLVALLGSAAQFASTLLIGVLSLAAIVLMFPGLSVFGTGSDVLLLLVLSVIAGMALLVFFNTGPLLRTLSRIPLIGRFAMQPEILAGHSDRDRFKVLGLSIARYALFATQFVLLLAMCCGDVHWKVATLAVPLIYVVATLVPTMVLSELGVRGSTAVAILSPWGLEEPGILMACFALWIINIVLPAAIGALLLVGRNDTRTAPATAATSRSAA
jgi:uncharacterized membrane protein YbhN (UPF0104 family)